MGCVTVRSLDVDGPTIPARVKIRAAKALDHVTDRDDDLRA